MTQPSRTVILEIPGPLARITLARPPVNSLNAAMISQFDEALAVLESTPDVRAVIITGAGRCFAAGADLAEISDLSVAEMDVWNRRLERTIDRLARLPIPVIAAVNGHALGGGLEIALAADFRFIAATATVGLPEVTLAIVPGAGGMTRLSRLIGPTQAMELIMTGARLDADAAGTIGIGRRSDDALADATDLAERITRWSPVAVRTIKQAIVAGADAPLQSALTGDRAALTTAFATPQARDAIGAFIRR
ncbi:MAG: enoyl-CoA hydratase-related protein [Gordonia sp. (in: high G+C Gram-positive bacteria)]